MYGGEPRDEERPVEDELPEDTDEGTTAAKPPIFSGERLGDAYGGEPPKVIDTPGAMLKTDQTPVSVDLDALLRTGKAKITPEGTTNNYILKNPIGAMQETDFNLTFDTIANKPREHYEVLYNLREITERMAPFFGKDAVPQTFDIARCRVVEGNGLRLTGNKEQWTALGEDLYKGIIDKVCPVHRFGPGQIIGSV